MILKIDHASLKYSELIYDIFQRSYAVEAGLLNHDDFPPLKRSAVQIALSNNLFYGFYKQDLLCAVTELESYEDHIHIRSLTVDPIHFRQGIANQLLTFVCDHFPVKKYTVETGYKNHPAVNLYLHFGFREERIFMTEAGIEKISFVMDECSGVNR
jgi:ribosomal protein S18 acetylase RimI-like enzyme